MIEDVLVRPHQIGDALWRIESAGIPRRSLAGGVAVCGPERGGDLAAAALGERATAPVRDGPPEDGAFVLCASYSGDDAEALSCFDEAGRRGCPRAVVCTAGALAARAREQRVPVIGVPAGMPPAAAVVYFTLAALECTALAGAGPSLRDEAEAAVPSLQALAHEEGRARVLAERLSARVPVIHGEPAVARRWAEQIRASTGAPAFASDDQPPSDGPLEHVELDALGAPSAPPLERVLWLVMLGDLVAAHLAEPPSTPQNLDTTVLRLAADDPRPDDQRGG